jgi:16S rRNA (cytidine1402-2'-O)-methyltransferase
LTGRLSAPNLEDPGAKVNLGARHRRPLQDQGLGMGDQEPQDENAPPLQATPGPAYAAPKTGLRLSPGLHLVATPIGAARDITLHGLDLLAGADLLAAEDTRTLRHLMEIHGIPLGGRAVLAHHDHASAAVMERIMTALRAGKVVAYASDAGTPLISDPGFDLVRAALAEDLPVHAAPGASALLAALTVAGLPTDRFFFAGFLPPKSAARKAALRELATIPGSIIFYESPRRIHASISEILDVFGKDRRAAICRELTKRHEEVLRGTVGSLAEQIAGRELKGEIVLILDRGVAEVQSDADVETALRQELQDHSLKEAVARVAARLGRPRRDVYQLALALEPEA